jgi:hypothetical protein
MAAPTTPEAYLESVPPGRREIVEAIRDVINENLPEGYEEGIQYGMIGWYVPLERFADTYNKQPLGLAGVANRKQYATLYLNSVYGNREIEEWFKRRWAETGKRLNMGKSCVYLKKLDDAPLEVVGETIAKVPLDQYVAYYERRGGRTARPGARRSPNRPASSGDILAT